MSNIFRVFVITFCLAVAQPAGAALNVFACEPEWAALSKELGGAAVNVYAATTAQQDPHHIQARPSLIARLRNADLLVCTGAELEIGWLPVLQRQAGNDKVQLGQPGYFLAADQVVKLGVPAHVDRSMGDVHPYGNPHIQTDPRRILTVAAALSERLGELDPAQRDAYTKRFTDFKQRWQAAMARWEQQAASLRGIPVVSHHENWAYLYDWLGIREVGTLEPKPGIAPSASHLAQLKAQLTTQPARMVIRAAYQDPRAAEWLNEQTGLPIVVLPFTVGGTKRAVDLFSLFDDTVDRLLQALT